MKREFITEPLKGGGYVVKVAYDGVITGMPEFFDTLDDVEEFKKSF